MATENEFTPEDELKAENEVLRLKLEMEHGMKHSETGNLPPQVENEWLNYISNFEKMHQDAKQVKLYEFIGSPVYKKFEDLDKQEVGPELEKIFEAMTQNGISLGFDCEYEDALIYKFITEEFFEHEVEDIRIEGMTSNFSYEEFHPNHDYDLRRAASEFVEGIFKGKWNEEFDCYQLAEPVEYNGTEYNNHGISEIIMAFQDANEPLASGKAEISEVTFSLEEVQAMVRLNLDYTGNSTGRFPKQYAGEGFIKFKYQYGFWYISEFAIPGLGK